MTEAAAYVGVPRATFGSWVNGYARRGRNGIVHGEPIITAASNDGLTVRFVGLAEGMVLAAFRETGVPLQRIRQALAKLEAERGVAHALASRRLFTDGAELLFDYATDHGDKQLRLLTVVRSGQRVFHEVIEQYLTRIEYKDGWATRIILPTTSDPILEVEPSRAFGQPVFINGGARLVDVEQRVRAGEPAEHVAKDYGLVVKEVRAALSSPSARAA